MPRLPRTAGAGNDGAGRSIAIVARTDIELSDVRTFRRSFGLPANDPVFVHNGPDPGILDAGDEEESDLDTQWAGAVAPRATIKLVISGSTNAGDGSSRHRGCRRTARATSPTSSSPPRGTTATSSSKGASSSPWVAPPPRRPAGPG